MAVTIKGFLIFKVMKRSEIQKQVDDFISDNSDNSKNDITAEKFRNRFLHVLIDGSKNNNQ